VSEVPAPARGSGPVHRCGGHRERCIFGRPHAWTTWYENAQLQRTPDTCHCYHCGGVCTAGEQLGDQMTDQAPTLTGCGAGGDRWTLKVADGTRLTLDQARAHIGEPVIYHPPAYAVGEVRAGVIVRVCERDEGPYLIVRYEGDGHDKATHAEHLTLMRGGSVREHFRLNLAEAGIPVAHDEEA
jgi:hypothetical protein